MAVPFYGDFDTTETVYLPFNTFDSNDPSGSVTVTTLLNTDCYVHKDGPATERSSSAGETLSLNVGTVDGNHMLALDLSDNTDAGFYANGSQYSVRIEGATVDGGNINAWIGSFSIGRTLRPTTAGRTLDVTAGGAAGIDWGNVENKTTANDLSATDIQLVDTTTTNSDMRGTDSAALASVCTEGRLAELDAANLPADVDAILADTNELQGDWTNGGRLDLILDAVLALLDDARAEPAQGAPPVNPDAMTKLDYLYKSWRNKKDNDASTTQLYADDGTTVDHKQTTSVAGGTVTKAEWVTGP